MPEFDTDVIRNIIELTERCKKAEAERDELKEEVAKVQKDNDDLRQEVVAWRGGW